MAQTVKNPPTIQETQGQPLGREDPLKKGMATTPVFLPGEFLGHRSLAGYSQTQLRNTHTHTHTHTHGQTQLRNTHTHTHTR